MDCTASPFIVASALSLLLGEGTRHPDFAVRDFITDDRRQIQMPVQHNRQALIQILLGNGRKQLLSYITELDVNLLFPARAARRIVAELMAA